MKCDKCHSNEAEFIEEYMLIEKKRRRLCRQCAIEYIDVKPYFHCTYCECYADAKDVVFVDDSPYCCIECALENYHINKIEGKDDV